MPCLSSSASTASFSAAIEISFSLLWALSIIPPAGLALPSHSSPLEQFKPWPSADVEDVAPSTSEEGLSNFPVVRHKMNVLSSHQASDSGFLSICILEEGCQLNLGITVKQDLKKMFEKPQVPPSS